MRILVDADACPVKEEILALAEEFGAEAVMVTDSSHLLDAGRCRVVTVDTGRDSADFKLISLTEAGDIVVTQDYGVAAMALGKGAGVLHPGGMRYTDENMDRLLLERHLGQKLRRSGGRTRGPRRRTAADDAAFSRALRALLEQSCGAGR